MGLPPRVSRDDPTPSPRPRLGAEAGRASRRAGNEATPGDGATEAAEALGGAAEQRTARSRLGAALLPAPRARGRALLSRAPLWEPGRSRLAKGVEGPLRLRRLAQPQDSRCAKGLARGDVIAMTMTLSYRKRSVVRPRAEERRQSFASRPPRSRSASSSFFADPRESLLPPSSSVT